MKKTTTKNNKTTATKATNKKGVETMKEEKKTTTATEQTAANVAKKEDFTISEWYEKNLGALDCEQSAWQLCQTLTTCNIDKELCKHVYSDGKKMYCTNGKALVVMSAPVMPAGVYDTVLAGKGKAKRRAFIPMNVKNEVEIMSNMEKDVDSKKTIAEPEVFNFSIQQPLNSEIFALLFYLAIKGNNCTLADDALDIVAASCQENLTCTIKDNFVIFHNDIIKIIFMALRPKTPQQITANRVLASIARYSGKTLATAETTEKKEDKKEEPEAVKEAVPEEKKEPEAAAPAKKESKIKTTVKKYKGKKK